MEGKCKGIPDHLKVEGGASLKHHNGLVEPPPRSIRVLFQNLYQDSKYVDLQAITKSSGSACKQSEEQSEEGDFGVNMPPPLPQEPCALSLCPQPIPFHSNSINQSMEETDEETDEETEEGGSYGWTIEYSNGSTFLVRDCDDDDFIEITYYNAVVIKGTGIVAAVGGIPEQLKIDHGISFSIPSPILKYPRVPPEDPTDFKKSMYESYKNAMESDAFINDFIKAYIKAKSKALGGGFSSHQKEAIHQPPPSPTMLEFNIAVTPGWYSYLRYIPSDPILRKLVMERNEDVKVVYIRETSKGHTLLYRHFDDFLEVVYLTGVIVKTPGFVAAVGGIPNELKIEGASTCWCLSPGVKFIKKQSQQYPSQSQQVQYEGVNDVAEFKKMSISKAFEQAVRKALLARHASSSSTIKQEIKEALVKNPLRPMVEVNVLEPQSPGSASVELNKGNNSET